MIRLGKIGAVAAGFLVCAGCDDAGFLPDAELEIAYGVEYGTSEGGAVSFAHDSDSDGRPTVWYEVPGFMPAFDGHPAKSEGLGYPLHDCSDRQIRCLQLGMDSVIAIPRGRMARGQTFEAAGADLEVLACEDASCALALMRTRCAFWEMLDKDGMSFRCIREDTGDAAEGAPVTFLYDQDRGVVAIGVEADACQTPFVAADCVSEHGFLLTSEVGLLARSVKTD